MLVRLPGVGRLHPLVGARRPAAHHGVGDFRVELQGDRVRPVLEGLRREKIAFRQQRRAAWQVEALAVPLIDRARHLAAERGVAGGGRLDVVIADLGRAAGLVEHAVAEVARQHLAAETHAEKRLLLFQWNADPVGLARHPLVGIIGAHRTAENDGAGVVRHRFRQRIVEARAADVQLAALLDQQAADPARRRMLLVQDDQNAARVRFGGHGLRCPSIGALIQAFVVIFRPRPAAWPDGPRAAAG